MDILSLGEKIKKLRKEKNLTLKELAGDRITAAQISHIERDKSHTSQELLEYLADKLEVSVDYLLETKEMQSKKITDNLLMKSDIYIKCGDLEKAELQLQEVLKVCKDFNLTENYGKCNFLLGNISLKKQKYDDAVSNFEKALYFFIKSNDKEDIFKCYLNIGTIYMKEEFYKGAVSHFDIAEDILNEIGDSNIEVYKNLYSSKSYCYMKLDRFNESLEYLYKIEDIDKKNSLKEDVDTLVFKANNLLNLGKVEESKELFREALEILEEDENKSKQAGIYMTICDIFDNIGDKKRLLEYSKKAYEIKKNDDDECTVESLNKLVVAYIDNDDYEQARVYCKNLLAIAIKNKDKRNEYKALKLYADMYRRQGQSDIAIEYLLKCVNIGTILEDDGILANLYLELGQLYTNISKDKELEYYQKALSIYKYLEII